MNIGTHCSLTTCSALDFLPIKCSLCQKIFCKDHSTSSNTSTSTSHSCNSIDNSRNNVKGNKFDEKFNDLLPDVNRGLGEEYDEKEREKLKRKAAAQELIKKNFGSKLASTSSSIDISNTTSVKKKMKVTPVIELMKLKQRAKQGDPRKSTGEIPMDQRVYFQVIYLEQEGEVAVEISMKELWLSKTTSIGKALDLFSVHFGIDNVNNTSQDRTKLLILATPATEIGLEQKLSSELEFSSVIPNGGVVHLLRGSSL